MKALLRTFLIWLLLAGVPLQGFAASTMLLCAPPAAAMPVMQAAPATAHHDHAAMLAAQHQADASDGDTVRKAGHHGPDAKCSGAAFCCTGAPLATTMPTAPVLPAAGSAPIPFDTAAPAAVDLAGIERPPKRLHA